jgi:hypothetical protein
VPSNVTPKSLANVLMKSEVSSWRFTVFILSSQKDAATENRIQQQVLLNLFAQKERGRTVCEERSAPKDVARKHAHRFVASSMLVLCSCATRGGQYGFDFRAEGVALAYHLGQPNSCGLVSDAPRAVRLGKGPIRLYENDSCSRSEKNLEVQNHSRSN